MISSIVMPAIYIYHVTCRVTRGCQQLASAERSHGTRVTGPRQVAQMNYHLAATAYIYTIYIYTYIVAIRDTNLVTRIPTLWQGVCGSRTIGVSCWVKNKECIFEWSWSAESKVQSLSKPRLLPEPRLVMTVTAITNWTYHLYYHSIKICYDTGASCYSLWWIFIAL